MFTKEAGNKQVQYYINSGVGYDVEVPLTFHALMRDELAKTSRKTDYGNKLL